MQAFTAAADYLRGKYLKECTLYVTIEPCVMCSGAAYWTQLKRVVFGAKDEKRGVSNLGIELLHPKTTLTSGVLENECSKLMSVFFGTKRS
jgi:tRNA(adenine34) deaminase